MSTHAYLGKHFIWMTQGNEMRGADLQQLNTISPDNSVTNGVWCEM